MDMTWTPLTDTSHGCLLQRSQWQTTDEVVDLGMHYVGTLEKSRSIETDETRGKPRVARI
jgi:hypothetical protein